MATDRTFSRPIGPLAAVSWSAAFLVIAVLLVGLAASGKGGSIDVFTATFLHLAAILLVIFLILRVHAPEADLGEVVGLRILGPIAGSLAAVTGAAASIPVSALESAIERRWPDPAPLDLALLYPSATPLGRIASLVASAVVYAVATELLFRGALPTGLLRSGTKGRAAVVTSLAYALVASSGDQRYLAVHLVMGLIFVHARLATGSVLSAIVAHVGYRVGELAWGHRVYGGLDPLRMTPPTPVPPIWIVVVASVAAIVAGGLLAAIGLGEDHPLHREGSKAKEPTKPTEGGDDA
jgi:membrane protease YdiL (CAAX protease family)